MIEKENILKVDNHKMKLPWVRSLFLVLFYSYPFRPILFSPSRAKMDSDQNLLIRRYLLRPIFFSEKDILELNVTTGRLFRTKKHDRCIISVHAVKIEAAD